MSRRAQLAAALGVGMVLSPLDGLAWCVSVIVLLALRALEVAL